MQSISLNQISNYEDLNFELEDSPRDRKKSAGTNNRSRSKKRSNRKRSGQSAIVGMSHRRLHRWT